MSNKLNTEYLMVERGLPDPSEEEIAAMAHLLSEWLDDAAPLHERRYRQPGKAALKFAAFIASRKEPTNVK